MAYGDFKGTTEVYAATLAGDSWTFTPATNRQLFIDSITITIIKSAEADVAYCSFTPVGGSGGVNACVTYTSGANVAACGHFPFPQGLPVTGNVTMSFKQAANLATSGTNTATVYGMITYHYE